MLAPSSESRPAATARAALPRAVLRRSRLLAAPPGVWGSRPPAGLVRHRGVRAALATPWPGRARQAGR
eukprot:2824794-Alexandrium_andersonii.AAC.1